MTYPATPESGFYKIPPPRLDLQYYHYHHQYQAIMQLTTLLLTLLPVLVAGRPHEPRDLTPGIEGYSIEDFTWEVPTTPGGSTTQVTGTVQDVVDKLDSLNPNWKDDFNFTTSDTASSLVSRSDGARLQKRGWNLPGLCNLRTSEWGYAAIPTLIDGINYLRGVPGRPTRGPGPGSCGRVSCSYNTAIYWCNDRTSSQTLGSFSDIANGADILGGSCAYAYWVFAVPYMNGQLFHSDNWNVIVRGDSC
ncbi:hypothetical protein jhhlp_008765 [Lomentospora prolificans]|uniref:Uncharacterized protein n=1 Tax=Lomentospora prolificans TaxID=41688 RepID=A0A2N3MYY9_9PEZI|nr:hypothetical protein jhhlp_008765 [Lomentospora prolificans]